MQQWIDIGAALSDALVWVGCTRILKLAAAANAFAIFP
jgi:hypothetical protein